MKNKILEISWLILAIITLGIGIYEWIENGFIQAYRFFIFFIITFLLFFRRRYLRKNLKNEKPDDKLD